MAMQKIAVLALLTLAQPALVPAQQPGGEKAPAGRQRLTPQALWEMKRLGSPQLSPDGRSVVFTVQEWSIAKNKSTTNLWLADVASGATRRLTSAAVSDTSPQWDPQGRRLAFVAKRGEDENAALYVMPVDGGEPQQIVELPFAVSAPRFMPDGRSLPASPRTGSTATSTTT